MTSTLSPIQPRTCEADTRCARPPRFQARLEAASGTRRVRKNAGACADHLGDMVQALTAWARDHDLTDGQLTVLTIAPIFDSVPPAVRPDRGGPETLGLAFSIIRLTR
jgi:hypothetical protein